MKISMAIKIAVILMMLMGVYGCAYRYYLGMHGPSIRAFPDVHEDVLEDDECLQCHHPENDPEGPPTSHPGFSGCLKCHNGDI